MREWKQPPQYPTLGVAVPVAGNGYTGGNRGKIRVTEVSKPVRKHVLKRGRHSA